MIVSTGAEARLEAGGISKLEPSLELRFRGAVEVGGDVSGKADREGDQNIADRGAPSRGPGRGLELAVRRGFRENLCHSPVEPERVRPAEARNAGAGSWCHRAEQALEGDLDALPPGQGRSRA